MRWCNYLWLFGNCNCNFVQLTLLLWQFSSLAILATCSGDARLILEILESIENSFLLHCSIITLKNVTIENTIREGYFNGIPLQCSIVTFFTTKLVIVFLVISIQPWPFVLTVFTVHVSWSINLNCSNVANFQAFCTIMTFIF